MVGVVSSIVATALHPEAGRDEHFRLGGLPFVAGGEQGIPCLRKPLGISAAALCTEDGPTVEELGPLRVVLRPQSKRGVVEALGRVGRVERRGPVAGVAQRTPGRLVQRPVRSTS